MARRRRGGSSNLLMYGIGAVGLYMLFSKAPASPLPAAGQPTEYWINPETFQLWYEWGGTTSAPQAGMRPASSFEISTYWPPVNHPEFATDSTVVY